MWWLALGLSFTGAALMHGLLARLFPTRNVVLLFVLGGSLIGATLLLWTGRAYGVLSAETFCALIAYGAYCELYLFLFTLALSSVSANIVARLEHGPRHKSELNEIYDPLRMVEDRLARMMRSGLIESGNGSLRLTRRGLLIVRSYRGLRRFFRHAAQPPEVSS